MRLFRFSLAITAAIGAGCATTSSSTPKPATEDKAQTARDLEEGKRMYTLHCARCHGPDGKDESYPFIKRLDGIGKRMTPEQILEATWETGLVARDSLTPDEQRCLGIYVATL